MLIPSFRPGGKTFMTGVLLLLFSWSVSAQNNTFSPYSRYGYGILSEPAFGGASGMGGIGYGLRTSGQINPMNPASYSAVDSLNFLFDFGLSATYTRFRENNLREARLNSNIEYAAIKIPLSKDWGLSLGLYEYTKLGYAFNSAGSLTDLDGNSLIYSNAYSATGGINNAYLGSSVLLFKHLSLGMNLNYKFGALVNSSVLSYPYNSEINSTSSSNVMTVGHFNIDAGLQYEQQFNNKHRMVLGMSFTPGGLMDVNYTSTTITLDTLTQEHPGLSFGYPQNLGLGVSYTYDNRLILGMDFQHQAWNQAPFFGVSDSLSLRTRLALGAEYLPSSIAQRYYQAIKYRLGLHYSDSYIKFAQGNLKEFGLSLGLGLPLRNQRTALNLAMEFGKILTPEPSMIQEHYWRIKLNLSFNETWFVKRRFN